MRRAQKEMHSLSSKKRSGMTPFIYTPEKFAEDAATQNIGTTKNGSKLKSKMHLLNGDKVLEQLMIWLKNFEDKILKNVVLIVPAKLAIFQLLVDIKAQTIASKVEGEFWGYSEPANVDEL